MTLHLIIYNRPYKARCTGHEWLLETGLSTIAKLSTRFDQPLLCSTVCSIHAANPRSSTRYSLHPVVAITPFAHILAMLC
ncbi:MAG: hypothetical protein ACYDDD_01825 [Acidithiobacillus ferrivorans]